MFLTKVSYIKYGVYRNPFESPQFCKIGVEVVTQIPRLEFELGVNSIPKFANGIGIGIDGIVPMTDLYI